MSLDRQDLVPTETILDHPGTVVLSVSTLVLFVGAVVVCMWRRRARARFIEAARTCFAALPPDPLVEGPVTLAGTVEATQPELPVVSVDMSPHDKWDNVSERAPRFDEIVMQPMARPFTLVLNGTKERLLVRPSADVDVWSRQLQVQRTKPGSMSSSCVSIAAVAPGERVIVRGRLSRDPQGENDESYREHYRGLVLHAAEGERLVIEAESTVAVLEAAAPGVSELVGVLIAAFIYVGAIGLYLLVLALTRGPDVHAVDNVLDTMSTTSWLVLLVLAGAFFPLLLGSYANTWSPWYGSRAYSGLTYRQRG
ncbi:MAG: hypothetical protein ABI193_24070 [Minicystis sp.]